MFCESFTMVYVVCTRENARLGPEYCEQGITGRQSIMIAKHSSKNAYLAKGMLTTSGSPRGTTWSSLAMAVHTMGNGYCGATTDQ